MGLSHTILVDPYTGISTQSKKFYNFIGELLYIAEYGEKNRILVEPKWLHTGSVQLRMCLHIRTASLTGSSMSSKSWAAAPAKEWGLCEQMTRTVRRTPRLKKGLAK